MHVTGKIRGIGRHQDRHGELVGRQAHGVTRKDEE
jgi:hypothetical protein